jgi:hypothetical protein
MFHGFNFLTPVALGGGAEPRFVALIVSPYSSIKNLESNFFCFGGKIGKGQYFERIYKGLSFGDIYSVPLPSAKSRWSTYYLMKIMSKKSFTYVFYFIFKLPSSWGEIFKYLFCFFLWKRLIILKVSHEVSGVLKLSSYWLK